MNAGEDLVLCRLKPQFREVFSRDAYRERVPDGITKYMSVFDRPLSLEPLSDVMKTGLFRFASLPRQQRNESDAWFAPRIHAALRLYRREAADVSIWHYLTVVAFREYVLWRWADAQGLVTEERVVGGDRRNAIGHLWWAAEVGRNGSDYAPVVQACVLQEVLVTLTDILATHNRAAAQAFIRFIYNSKQVQRSADEIKLIRRALNHSLSTYTLDAAAPDVGPDGDAADAWVHELPATTLTSNDLPIGPDEPGVPEELICEIQKQMENVDRQMAELSSVRV